MAIIAAAAALLVGSCLPDKLASAPEEVFVQQVALSPSAATVATGAQRQFSVVVTMSDGSQETVPVNWTATGGSVSATGLYTAGTTAGSYRVIAAETESGNDLADTAQVTITATPPSGPVIDAIVVAPPAVNLSSGEQQQFTVKALMSDGTQKSVAVNWSSTGGSITAGGMYTAGSTPGNYRVIAVETESGSAHADTAEITNITAPPPPPPPSGAIADPSALPTAQRQAPDFARYTGAALSSGQSYLDPVTNVRVWKVTDAATPVANVGGMHDYASGAVQISREWTGAGGPTHTLLLMTENSGHYFVDLTRGQGLSNWRPTPSVNADLCVTFSYNPATPRIAYYLSGTVLRRYNTATSANEPAGNFPHDFGGTQLTWLQQDRNDEWFVMMPRDQSRVIAWNSVTNQVLSRTPAQLGIGSLDEPHLERNGRFVLVRSGSAAWASWDLVNDVVVAGNPGGQTHPGVARGFFTGFDPNDGAGPFWRYDPSTRAAAVFMNGQNQGSVAEQHRGDQWVMSDQELPGGDLRKQWIVFDNYDDGRRGTYTWALDAGQVYSSAANVGNYYDYATVGIQAVRQFVAGNTDRVAYSLTRATSRAAMVEGSFFYDRAGNRLYVWAQGGGSPAGRVEPRIAGAIHEAVALYRLDGSETKILAHSYSVGVPDYWQSPRATISPDGKVVMFDSNMNNATGRGDVFVAEVPLK
jgi:hypothetical protein